MEQHEIESTPIKKQQDGSFPPEGQGREKQFFVPGGTPWLPKKGEWQEGEKSFFVPGGAQFQVQEVSSGGKTGVGVESNSKRQDEKVKAQEKSMQKGNSADLPPKSQVERENVDKRITKFIEPELRPDSGNCLYLGEEEMKKQGLVLGQWIRIVHGEQEFWAQIKASVKRDDGSREDSTSPYLRASQKVWDDLRISRGSICMPEWGISSADHSKIELRISSVDKETSKLVHSQELCAIAIERELGEDDAVGLTDEQQQQFGVSAGEKIWLRFGKGRREVVIKTVEQEGRGVPISISEKTATEMKLDDVQQIAFRLKFDKQSQELSFGPSIAYFTSQEIKEGMRRQEEFEIFNKLGQEYGAFVCIINDDFKKQDPELIKRGFIKAHIRKNGKFVPVEIPIPDVMHERAGNANKEFIPLFEHSILPRWVQDVTRHKVKFADALKKEEELSGFIPDAISLTASNADGFESFFALHNEAILKPDVGVDGKNIKTIRKEKDGSYSVFTGIGAEGDAKRYATFDEIKREVVAKEDYVLQEKVESVRYTYNDPGVEDEKEIVGKPEPRILVQRGPDGQIRIASAVARIQNFVALGGLPHNEDLTFVLEKIFGEKADSVLEQIRYVSCNTFKAIEKAAKQEVGELPIDLIITPSGRPVVLEVNSKGLYRESTQFRRWGSAGPITLYDGRYYSAAGAIQRALYLTGF